MGFPGGSVGKESACTVGDSGWVLGSGLLLLLLSHFSHVRLCDPMDSSPPGFPIPGILQARTQEWVAISFSNAWKWSLSVMFDPQRPHGLPPSRLLHPWDFLGKSTGVGCHCLLRPLGLTGLISLLSKTLKSLLKHHSSKASILRCSAFFTVQLSHPYMTTGKTIA